MLLQFPLTESVASVGSFGVQAIKNAFDGEEPTTYEEFVTSKFGKKLYQTVFEPMAKKMFGDPQELDRKLAEVAHFFARIDRGFKTSPLAKESG